MADEYFLYIYTFEMFIKQLAYGIVLKKDAYLRDFWNILDFIIIISGWISYFLCKFVYLFIYLFI